MRPYSSKKAFTLIELLAVICVIVILGAMLLPSMSGSGKHSKMLWCLNNQKQITLGFMIWQGDHHGNFPWQISVTNNGTMEPSSEGDAAPNFNVLLPYHKPQIFICPTDSIKTVATNQVKVGDQNISYFVGIDGSKNSPAAILTGDRHLDVNGKPVKSGLFVYSNNLEMNWSLELHKSSPSPAGAMVFGDGHVQVVRDRDLDGIFRKQGVVASRYVIP